MTPNSCWLDQIQRKTYPPLKGKLQTDVLIIGGGLYGLLCAYFLTQRKISPVLVEANQIMGGTSGHTTAKITAQHGLFYDTLIQKFGVEQASLYAQANLNAIEKYAEITKSNNIDCDFQRKKAVLYTTLQSDAQRLINEKLAYDKVGLKGRLTKETELPFFIETALEIENQAQFHPVKFGLGIASGFPIYENTRVMEIGTKRPYIVKTKDAVITAEHVIVATHFPILNQHGLYFAKMHAERSYVVAVPGSELNGMYINYGDTVRSFRSWNGLILLGGEGHKTGKCDDTEQCYKKLEESANQYYPGANVSHRWSAQDLFSLDSVPYCGLYAKALPGMYTAAGFGKWGMTNAMVSAQLTTDLIAQGHSPLENLFDPHRAKPFAGAKELLENSGETVMGLAQSAVHDHHCSHLGCVLKYNTAEKSWDCPCHGSRFDQNGHVLEGPAVKDLQGLERQNDTDN